MAYKDSDNASSVLWCYRLRRTTFHHVVPPMSAFHAIDDRAFTVAAAHSWNKIPLHVTGDIILDARYYRNITIVLSYCAESACTATLSHSDVLSTTACFTFRNQSRCVIFSSSNNNNCCDYNNNNRRLVFLKYCKHYLPTYGNTAEILLVRLRLKTLTQSVRPWIVRNNPTSRSRSCSSAVPHHASGTLSLSIFA